jgi:hypothetical protein
VLLMVRVQWFGRHRWLHTSDAASRKDERTHPGVCCECARAQYVMQTCADVVVINSGFHALHLHSADESLTFRGCVDRVRCTRVTHQQTKSERAVGARVCRRHAQTHQYHAQQSICWQAVRAHTVCLCHHTCNAGVCCGAPPTRSRATDASHAHSSHSSMRTLVRSSVVS